MSADGNPIIHQATRLRIMAALARLAVDVSLEFTRLRAILQTTDGNLGTHIEVLEKAGYLAVAKSFEGRKPVTRVAATAEGRRAFTDHVAYLRGIIEQGE